MKTTGQEFFEEKYRQSPDPWSFGSSPYELGRYDAMFNLLQCERYARAFEPGCSLGVFTVSLASLCDRVEALDISPTAVEQARRRCMNLPNVVVNCGALPDALPEGRFDLVILSEIGYYFTEEQLVALVRQLVERIPPSGTLFATHWLGHSADHLLPGDRVHQIIEQSAGLVLKRSERHESFRIDVWKKQ